MCVFPQRQEFTLQSDNILKESEMVCVKNSRSPAFCGEGAGVQALVAEYLGLCEAVMLISEVFFRTWWH